MTKPVLCCAALLWPVAATFAKDPAPATPGTAPAAAPAAPAAPLSPAEARTRLGQALGTYFASRQKSQPSEEPVDMQSFKKGVADIMATGQQKLRPGSAVCRPVGS